MMHLDNSIVFFWLVPVFIQIILPLAMLLVFAMVKLPTLVLRQWSASQNVKRRSGEPAESAVQPRVVA